MTKKREKKLSTIGFLIAKAIRENDDVQFGCTDISIDELRELEKQFRFTVFVKAYLHNLNASRNYSDTLTLTDAVATITLSWLTPSKRSREDVIDLLKTIGVGNPSKWLEGYEALHDVVWFSEEDRQ